jgi:hypothetical protein
VQRCGCGVSSPKPQTPRLMINRTPKLVWLAVDPNEYLVQVPAPDRFKTMVNLSFTDVAANISPNRSHWHRSVSCRYQCHVRTEGLRPDGEITDSGCKSSPSGEQSRRTVEITERISHRRGLRGRHGCLKAIWSDHVHETVLVPDPHVEAGVALVFGLPGYTCTTNRMPMAQAGAVRGVAK